MTEDPAAMLTRAAEEIRVSEPMKGTRWGDALLALADWLEYESLWLGQETIDMPLAVARAILGPGWAFQQAARDLAAIDQDLTKPSPGLVIDPQRCSKCGAEVIGLHVCMNTTVR